jgi:hypothetical protein
MISFVWLGLMLKWTGIKLDRVAEAATLARQCNPSY